MIKYVSLCTFMLLSFFASTQINVDLVAHVDFVADGKGNGNDIWGYVAPDGTEYAIVGTTTGTLVYSLEDPTNPIERVFIPGSNSTWRDMKQWGEYVYVTADAGNDGLLIIDMQGAPDNIEHIFRKPELPISTGGSITLERCHNIYLDENGFIYLAGCHGRGVDFFDPTIDPWEPVHRGAIEGPYHHDDYAKGDTLYSSRIFEGDLAMFDVSDKSAPELLGTVNTTSNFTHNAWADPTNTYAFTTDERAEGFLDAYDVSDPTNMVFLDKFQVPGTEGTGTIPHNTHYHNGYLVTSWYTSGLVVVDGNKPDNMVQVAQYDTYDGADGGFSGCWGTTPYLPSGVVLANDINSGFYVFDVDYKRACYLEGKVTDINTGAAINDVLVTVESGQYDAERTNAMGDYKYGQVDPGTFTVTFTHPLYDTETAEAILVNGEVTIVNIEMGSKPKFAVNFEVVDKITGASIPSSQIELIADGLEYVLKTDENGLASETVVSGSYNIFAGKWGYENIGFESFSIEAAETVTFELEEGYMDDFALDLGWTVVNEELGNFTGAWVRGFPNGTTDNGTTFNPGEDIEGDLGRQCYVTGNAAGASSFSDDVDNGITTLTSPVMDLTTHVNPTVEFSLWFMTAGGQMASDDVLNVYVNNGIEELLVATYQNLEGNDVWTEPYVIALDGEIAITDNMTLIVETSDLPGSGNIVEAGFDQFIVRGLPDNVTITEDSNLKIFPNPATDVIQLDHKDANISTVDIFNALGQKVMNFAPIATNTLAINVSSLTTGTYVVAVKLDNATSVIKTVVITK